VLSSHPVSGEGGQPPRRPEGAPGGRAAAPPAARQTLEPGGDRGPVPRAA